MTAEPWPTDWPPAAELYAITSAGSIDDIIAAGHLAVSGGLDVDWRDLARSGYTWTSLVRSALDAANTMRLMSELDL